MGMIKEIWDIGKDILDFIKTFKKEKKVKRETLSLLFADIGEVLRDTYEKLDKNIYPAGNCEQLELYSEELYRQTVGTLGEEKAKRLSDKLKHAHEVERLYGDIHVGKVDKKELMLLDEASGHFIAASKLVMV